jgi:putative ABC transport system permease protein
MSEFGPIARTLMRSKLGATLIIAQVALTVAILANVLPVVYERIQIVSRPSGIDEHALFAMDAMDSKGDARTALATRLEQERRLISGVPGVASTTFSNTYSNSNSGWSTGLSAKLGTESPSNAALYFSDANALQTYQLKLIAGRWFDAREISPLEPTENLNPKVLVLTESMAKTLFPEGNAVGKRVSLVPDATSLDSEVIGVVSDMGRPWPQRGAEYFSSAFVPKVQYGYGKWIVRIKPDARMDAVLQAVQQNLVKADRSVVYGQQAETFQAARLNAYSSDLVLCWLLSGFALLLVAVTALGIVGLASFWVTQRTRTIGVRRAMGARARDIARYFRQENLLLSSIGAVIGVGLAYALNYAISTQLGGEKLPFWPVAAGSVILIVLGQLAVTAPAKRASAIPPAIATRSA